MKNLPRMPVWSWITLLMLSAGLGLLGATAAEVGGAVEPALSRDPNPWRAVGLGGAAALAVGLSVLGAGYAVARVGTAALGTAAERPELMIRSLLFVALAEGLAVLGFAIAMMLLQKI